MCSRRRPARAWTAAWSTARPPPSCRTAPGGLGTRPRSRAPWPRTSAAVLVLALFATGTSFDRESRLEVYRVSIVSSTYYMLAQNPFWSISDTLEQVIGARVAGTEAALLRTVPEETAVRVTRETVAPGATFPSPRYPLVHTPVGEAGGRLARPDQRGGRRPSILVIFVEGLDRRFLGRTVRGIRVTPFLDRFRALAFRPFGRTTGATSSACRKH